MPLASPSRTRLRRWTRCAAGLLALGAVYLVSIDAHAAPKTHVVHSGQRLGSIAKRYNVSIEDLCVANGIRRTEKIFPGQKLIVPEPGKPVRPPPAGKAAAPAKTTPPAKSPAAVPQKRGAPYGHPLVHIVARGQNLGAIARRYGVSIEAICHASGVSRRGVLKIGQQLIVPATTDPEGKYARQVRLTGRLDNPAGPPTWQKYSKAPWRRGHITIQGHSRQWRGYVIGPGQKVLPQAREAISKVLGARAGGPGIDDRLIRLMAQVSDQFGGRPLRIVSGYRETSYVHDSKHKVGRALDFSVPGVPNEAVRDYCRTLGGVGVGYYPNSTFIHLDVRPHPAYWVDYAGPGEPPRLTPHARTSSDATARLSRKDPPVSAAGPTSDAPGLPSADGPSETSSAEPPALADQTGSAAAAPPSDG